MTPARDGRGSQCRERRRNPRGRQVTGRGQRHEAGGRRAPHTAVRCPTSARFSGPSARPSSFQCRWGGRHRGAGSRAWTGPPHLTTPSGHRASYKHAGWAQTPVRRRLTPAKGRLPEPPSPRSGPAGSAAGSGWGVTAPNKTQTHT